MTINNIKMTSKTIKTVLFSALLLSLMTPFAGMIPAEAIPQAEEPYEVATGQMQIATKIVDDTVLQVEYTFTSDQLKQKYGNIKIYRQQSFPLGDEQVTEQTVTKNVGMKLLHANDVGKLEAYQQAKNNGIPLTSHIKWDILVSTLVNPVIHNTLFVDYSSSAQIQPMTHVPNWTHTGQMWSPSDPINVIWNDSGGVPENIAQAARDNLVLNGWTESTTCSGATQYINYLGAWIPQEYQIYDVGDCDHIHLRIWDLTSDRAIGGAHAEFWRLDTYAIKHTSSTGPSGWETSIEGHVVSDFENAETQVNNKFSGCWTAYPDNHWLDNEYTREYYDNSSGQWIATANNDGYSSQINKSC